MADAKDKVTLKQRWERMPPGRRRKIATFGVLGGVVLLAFIAMTGSSGKGTTSANGVKSKIANALLPNKDARDLGVNGLSSDMEKLQKQGRQKNQQIAQLKSALNQQRNHTVNGSNYSQRRMAEQLNKLQQQIQSLEANQPSSGAAPVPRTQTGNASSAATGAEPQAMAAPKPVIRTIKAKAKPAPKIARVSSYQPPGTKIPVMYLPSGSLLTGVNITGIDAATGKGAMSNPMPMLVRIKHDAILPNRYRADVKECFLIASGYGNLASERAYMRATSISCVRRDGRVIDVPIEAIAIGPDGKAGIRGRLVSKQGQVIAKAALAGLAQGIAQAFGGGRNRDFYLQPGSLPSAGSAGADALSGGVGSAFDNIAKYYLNLANQMFPVIEIKPGQKISFLMIKGARMGVLK